MLMAGISLRPFRALAAAYVLACIVFPVSAYGDAVESPVVTPTAALGQGERSALPELSPEDALRRTHWLIGAGAAGVALYGATHWWQDGLTGHFRTVNEGWFGQDTYAGGADKLGHAYSSYVGTRLLTRGFGELGNAPERSLWLAAGTSLGVMTAVEVLDGYSKKYRFSKEDAIMNVLGTGMGVLLESKPELDKVLDFRLRYWPSDDARRLRQIDPVDDHTGQTYLLVAKAAGFDALRKHDSLRYLELAVGYGSRGYEPNTGNPDDRSRHIYYGVSLNLAEILGDTAFSGSYKGGRTQRITNTVLEFFQVPGTAALADHRL
jgi:hypothetical protein